MNNSHNSIAGGSIAFSIKAKVGDHIGLFECNLFCCQILIELIAYASYTDDELRIVRVFFDLFSQCTDIDHGSPGIIFHAVCFPYCFKYL